MSSKSVISIIIPYPAYVCQVFSYIYKNFILDIKRACTIYCTGPNDYIWKPLKSMPGSPTSFSGKIKSCCAESSKSYNLILALSIPITNFLYILQETKLNDTTTVSENEK